MLTMTTEYTQHHAVVTRQPFSIDSDQNDQKIWNPHKNAVDRVQVKINNPLLKIQIYELKIEFRRGSSVPSLSGSTTSSPVPTKDSHEFLETEHGPIIEHDETEEVFAKYIESATILKPHPEKEENNLELSEFLNLYKTN
jgi:hypothetical protein